MVGSSTTVKMTNIRSKFRRKTSEFMVPISRVHARQHQGLRGSLGRSCSSMSYGGSPGIIRDFSERISAPKSSGSWPDILQEDPPSHALVQKGFLAFGETELGRNLQRLLLPLNQRSSWSEAGKVSLGPLLPQHRLSTVCFLSQQCPSLSPKADLAAGSLAVAFILVWYPECY